MRLINADDIPYEEHYVPYGDEMWQYQKELCVIKPIIDAMPTEDPVKHGRWLYDSGEDRYFCSACDEHALQICLGVIYGAAHTDDCLSDYCPWCGAKMDGGKDV